ncbi:MAG TPA: DinB family protein [Gemmatimonadales bacterium]|nr:DinB family protein [Gemmatimonadales bacterium]
MPAAAMIPQFETGTPVTGLDHATALGALLASGTAYLSTLPDATFFAPQGEAWSPADHVRHLQLAGSPLLMALKLPRWLLALRFGRGPGHSRSFDEVRSLYIKALAAGGQAGRFTPRPRDPGPDSHANRMTIMKAWADVTVNLQGAVARWPETALDRQLLPHPLLGLLTTREMFSFTVYHTAHHLRRVAERAGA